MKNFKIMKKIQFDDPVNIQYTSGTTGFPKELHFLIITFLITDISLVSDFIIPKKTEFVFPVPFIIASEWSSEIYVVPLTVLPW